MLNKQSIINRITALEQLIVEANKTRSPRGEWTAVTIAKRMIDEYKQQLKEMEIGTNGNG